MLKADKSALRAAMPRDPIAARREYAGPALFSYGFRPFFLFGALWAALAAPIWMGVFLSGGATVGTAPALAWHVHEMVFGFLAAIIAGFLLTAVPNWTGGLAVMGGRLAGLFGLWAAGRAAMLAQGAAPVAAAIVDSAFLVLFAAMIWREVLLGGNRRNAPVCALTSLLALANIGFHAALITGADWRAAQGAAIAAVAMLIALIGGRITPSFTRNWMTQRGMSDLPAAMGAFDAGALAAAGAGLLAWILAPMDWFAGALLLIAGAMHAIRLARWKGWHTTAEPLVTILHVGYAWLPLGLVLMGASAIAPGPVPASAALHALTAGAMGTMTLAVMTRATLGHTGRDRAADAWTRLIYGLVVAGALIRVLAPIALGAGQYAALGAGAALWSAAFAVFVLRYGPMLVAPRR
ncbi:NnrS family protein [Marinicauda salina]|nr:NnrS family protein [Marinicauda salina]